MGKGKKGGGGGDSHKTYGVRLLPGGKNRDTTSLSIARAGGESKAGLGSRGGKGNSSSA